MSSVALLAPQGPQRWMVEAQVQGVWAGALWLVRVSKGAARQVGQRRRWREGRRDREGGLCVQFYIRQISWGIEALMLGGFTNPTDNPSAPPTSCH